MVVSCIFNYLFIPEMTSINAFTEIKSATSKTNGTDKQQAAFVKNVRVYNHWHFIVHISRMPFSLLK